METESKSYKFDYLLRGDLGDEKAFETSEAVRKMIEEGGGIITQENKPQKKTLAYPIKKHDMAYFGLFKIIFPKEKLQALDKSLKKLDLLRLLFSRIKPMQETAKRISKRRLVRQPMEKELQMAKSEIQLKEEVKVKEPLRVEEIDKKLEEILGQ